MQQGQKTIVKVKAKVAAKLVEIAVYALLGASGEARAKIAIWSK